MERKEIGIWLRQQREARCWSRPEMVRQLIRAAYAVNDRSMVDVDNLCHNIYRWERGTVSPSERYRLYYCQASRIRMPHSAAPKQQRLVHWFCRTDSAGKWASC